MKTRSFETSRWFIAVMCIALALVLLAAVYQVMAMAAPPEIPAEVPQEKPLGALYAISWQTTAITLPTNCTSYLTQNYSYQDLTCSFDFGSTQAVTVSLQASNDNSDWHQTHEFTVLTADTVTTTGIISRVLSYGRYTRMVLETRSSATVTPTCKSVFFNNWMPGDNAQSMPE